MLGISTCWWADSPLHGDELIVDVLDLGVDGIELEYRITNPLYQQMKPLLNRAIKILSIHNPFPRPEERFSEKASGDLFPLSSTDRDERSIAVKYALRSIEHACDLEVHALILHLGRVDMPNPIMRLKELHRSGRAHQEEGRAFLDEQMGIRVSRRRKNMDAVLFSLERLNEEAERKGILLCIENRCYLHEIPTFDEIGGILNKFDGGRVRYWHDVGHATIQENLGICRQSDLLEAYSEDMIGMHLHDVKGLDDHLSPGQGQIDFGQIRPYLKPSLLRIIEVSSHIGRRELQEGIKFTRRELEKGQ